MDKTNSSKAVLVSNLRKYTQLKEEEILEIVKSIPIETYAKGTVLLRQGFAPTCSYYLVEGCIRQYACDENGKEVTVNFFIEEESINMFSFLNNEGLSLYSLACLEECILVECPDLENNPDNDDSPEISNMKRLFFEKQFADMQINFTDFKLKTPEERFASLVKNKPELLNRVPQIYLASYLGITPETFSRFKKKLNP